MGTGVPVIVNGFKIFSVGRYSYLHVCGRAYGNLIVSAGAQEKPVNGAQAGKLKGYKPSSPSVYMEPFLVFVIFVGTVDPIGKQKRIGIVIGVRAVPFIGKKHLFFNRMYGQTQNKVFPLRGYLLCRKRRHLYNGLVCVIRTHSLYLLSL